MKIHLFKQSRCSKQRKSISKENKITNSYVQFLSRDVSEKNMVASPTMIEAFFRSTFS